MVSFQASLVLVFITLLLVFALCFSFPEAVFPLAVYLFISWSLFVSILPSAHLHLLLLAELSWLLSCPHAPTFPQPAGDRPPHLDFAGPEKMVDTGIANGEWRDLP